MDTRLSALIESVARASRADTFESNEMFITCGVLLEANHGTDEMRPFLQGIYGNLVPSWVFDMWLSDAEVAAIVDALVDFVLRVPEAVSAIHALRKTNCPELVRALRLIVDSGRNFSEGELIELAYAVSDVRPCPKEMTAPILESQRVKELLKRLKVE